MLIASEYFRSLRAARMHIWYPIVITFVFTVLSVLFKLLSRRDGDDSPFRNDCYIGQSLLLGSVSALAVYLVKSIISHNSDAALTCVLFLLGYIVVMVVLVCLDRWYGWEPGESSEGKFRRKWWLGILVPNFVGAGVYFAVFSLAKSLGL